MNTNPKGQSTLDKADFTLPAGMEKKHSDKSSNAYEVLPDNTQIFADNSTEEFVDNAVTMEDYTAVKESRKSGETGPHELGHTLGFKHKDGTIMSAADNVNREHKIDKDIILQILLNVGVGKKPLLFPNKYKGNGKGYLQPEEGTRPANFEKGHVIEVEAPNSPDH